MTELVAGMSHVPKTVLQHSETTHFRFAKFAVARADTSRVKQARIANFML
jgi:hypothetical protein